MENNMGAEITAKSRIKEVDMLRGLAIILMITGHSFIVHPINIHDVPWCQSLCHWIYTFHMELFFLLAGCVYHCSDYKKYICKKIDRIAVPYLFFSMIALLLHSIDMSAVNKQTSLGKGAMAIVTEGGFYWFLYALFLLYLIYPVVERVFKKPWMEWGFAVICILILEFIKVPTTFEFRDVVYYLPYFVAGRYLVKLLCSNRVNNHWVNIFILIGSLALFIVLDKVNPQIPSVISLIYVRALAMMLVLYVVVHYLLSLADKGTGIAKVSLQFLENCSTYSLQLYLFNGFILVITRTLLVTYLHVTSPVIIVGTLVTTNLIVTLLICNFILPKTKWLGWLCGTGNRPF